MDFVVPIHPESFAVVFGLQANDCRDELYGIVEQLKAEAWGMA